MTNPNSAPNDGPLKRVGEFAKDNKPLLLILGLFTTFNTIFISIKTENRADRAEIRTNFERIIDRYEIENTSLREANRLLLGRVRSLERKVLTLEAEINELKANSDESK